jgi:hypothetical protein
MMQGCALALQCERLTVVCVRVAARGARVFIYYNFVSFGFIL